MKAIAFTLFALGVSSLGHYPAGPGPNDSKLVRTAQSQDSVVITQLAVAGFMVTAGGKTLVIDALHRHPTQGPEPETRKKLESAAPPFDKIDIVLISHSHSDHFHTEAVASHLTHNPHAVVVTGKLVRDRLADHSDFDTFGDRVIAVTPEPEEIVEIEANGLQMKVFRVSHGERGNDYSMDNLAMMIDLAGTKIFNPGDIVPTGQTGIFEKARLHRDGIDIAFLPFTMFDETEYPEAAAIIDQYLEPRYIVPSHLYEQHFGAFTDKIEDRYPNSIIFRSQGEVKVLRRKQHE
jgi:L-ascorbate metabolism protein UlaG (beta-lactamase superfamily)